MDFLSVLGDSIEKPGGKRQTTFPYDMSSGTLGRWYFAHGKGMNAAYLDGSVLKTDATRLRESMKWERVSSTAAFYYVDSSRIEHSFKLQ